MWDCKHRQSADDSCNKRKTKCFPGGIACVLKGEYEFPLREDSDPLQKLTKHIKQLRACRSCSKMNPPVVSGGPVLSRVILVGQAPGDKEPKLGRPFAWTAGKTLFGWFKEGTGLDEAHFRSLIYMAAVCRCFPGKQPKGGDRAPDPQEVKNCSRWFKSELDILKPALVIPVGKLAIQQFLQFDKLVDVIGKQFKGTYVGHSFDVIPLPHPSGASPWHRMEPGKSLIVQALKRINKHPAFKELDKKGTL